MPILMAFPDDFGLAVGGEAFVLTRAQSSNRSSISHNAHLVDAFGKDDRLDNSKAANGCHQ